MRIAITLLLCMLGALTAIAQEDEEERGELAEISQRLREVEQRKEFADQQLRRLSTISNLLKQAKLVQKTILALEQEIEVAEARDDDRKIESLESRIDSNSQQIERIWQEIEIHEGIAELRTDVSQLPHEYAEEALGFFGPLLEIQEERLKLIPRLGKAQAEDDERREEEISTRLEQLAERFERGRELRFLQLELEIAHKEGNEEAIEVLEEELEHFLEETEDDKPFNGDQTEKEPAKDLPETAKALSFTDEQLESASRHSFERDIATRLKNACFSCHDTTAAMGDLDLESLITETPIVKNRNSWANVLSQLKNRSMPPAGEEEISEADRRAMAAWIEHTLENFDYTSVSSPGYEPAKRLTHDEYNNTIRDLFGIDLRPADKFPADMTATSGFDNSANSLFIQPITMERYINAADDIVAAALPDPAKTTPSARQQSAIAKLFAPAKGQSDVKAARAVLLNFAARAFRRPLHAVEIDALVDQYQRKRQDMTYNAAIRDVIRVVLVSPSFLLRTENAPENAQPQTVGNWELASRLSYFLWASMPDDQLYRAAATGRLRDKADLDAEITRMLEDSRAESLGTLFAAQWLGFTDLNRMQPDQIDNPWATNELIASMKAESAMFFNSLVRDNAPIERLVDADFSFMNATLARHYGIESVEGETMQRVSLSKNPRGGVLGHGSILAVTSLPGRTSPVMRGNWILSSLLGTPPPPPPPNVSEFDDEIAENRRLSPREKMEAHRNNPNCYACHSQIDPLGFSLQKFDWFGRYRGGRSQNLEDSAQLPDGTKFNGIEGLRNVIVDKKLDDLVRQMTQKMLAYALGRQLEYYDEATVRDIVRQVTQDNRRIQTLIRAIATSDPFLSKQIVQH